MKTLGVIRNKQKPALYNEFLNTLLKESGDATSFIVGKDKEIWEFWINALIEEVSEAQPESITWLIKHRHMLQEITEEGHTESWTGLIFAEPKKLQHKFRIA